MTDKVVIFSTCGSQQEAEQIARKLVEARLAACVSILAPVHSVYRWKDQVENSSEWMLVIKSRRPLVERLTAVLRNVHSYEIPEVIALAVVDGLPEYLDWIGRETGAADEDI